MYNLTNTYSNYSSLETFNQDGATDYTGLIDDFDNAYSTVEEQAGYILTQNLEDMSFRSALSLAGWKPGTDMEAQTVEWWEFDFEYGYNPVRARTSINDFAMLIGNRNKAQTCLPLSTMSVSILDSLGRAKFLVEHHILPIFRCE